METSTAVIARTLLAAAPPPGAVQHRTGLVGALENGWAAFTRTLGALATAFGAALVIALGALGRLLWVQLRARRPAAAGTTSAAPPTPPQ